MKIVFVLKAVIKMNKCWSTLKKDFYLKVCDIVFIYFHWIYSSFIKYISKSPHSIGQDKESRHQLHFTVVICEQSNL